MKSFTVIDRETNELRDTGLSVTQVLDHHIEQRQQSSASSLIRTLRPGQRISLGEVIVRREKVQ